jgi:hypothetical protein
MMMRLQQRHGLLITRFDAASVPRPLQLRITIKSRAFFAARNRGGEKSGVRVWN